MCRRKQKFQTYHTAVPVVVLKKRFARLNNADVFIWFKNINGDKVIGTLCVAKRHERCVFDVITKGL